MKSSAFLGKLFLTLPENRQLHMPSSREHRDLKKLVRADVERLLSTENTEMVSFLPFGTLSFPYHKLGDAVDSLNLFDLDELIMFSFYWKNKNKYQKVADLGANIGLHSIVLDHCGYQVHSYEPDPTHFAILQENLALNNCKNVIAYNHAVSSKQGKFSFTRVLGNTTGSHLTGAKTGVYGETEIFEVDVDAIGPIIEWADLLKIDVEGHEAEVLLATTREQLARTDILVEIGSPENAHRVFTHFSSMGVGMFAQKIGWEKVRNLDDMPISYQDGTLFIAMSDTMPW